MTKKLVMMVTAAALVWVSTTGSSAAQLPVATPNPRRTETGNRYSATAVASHLDDVLMSRDSLDV